MEKNRKISEAVPRIEHYKSTIQHVKRPSLSQLHGPENGKKDHAVDITEKNDQEDEENTEIKLGWIQGVLIPCLLNIYGVMLFLRMSWVVAEAGIGYSLVIIGISAIVCVITTLSLSALCTNGEIKGGGVYYIISRSLGPEFGASVGIIFAFANTVSASMNTIGFCNSLIDLLSIYHTKILDGNVNDTRIIGIVALVIMILVCSVGMDWESKAQNFLLVAIVAAMFDFVVGICMGPSNDLEKAEGFVGFNWKTFEENFYPGFRPTDNTTYDFFKVFAIFFPSVTGIQAGANISGDLKDPSMAIPKGTLIALAISMSTYSLFVLLLGGAALRDASGNVASNVTSCVTDFSCRYGLYNSYQMMQFMSAWWPLIYMGCWAATLSTALTNLLSVPRLIQALGMDRIYPGLIFFSKGYGKHKEPYRGYVLTFLVAAAFLFIANLNLIAPLISNFYLASYALINFCTFHAALVKPLGWRPNFKYYNTWLSFFGFVACIVIMFLIDWISSLITLIAILGLYLVVVYRKPDVNWGSSTQAQIYKTALSSTQKLHEIGEHVKNYRPQVLLLSGFPKSRPGLVDFAQLITKNTSLFLLGDITNSGFSHQERSSREELVKKYLKDKKIRAFYSLIDGMGFEHGALALLQTAGVGNLRPNVLMMGYKEDWTKCNSDGLDPYLNVLHAAFTHRLGVTIFRTQQKLLDKSHLNKSESSSEGSNKEQFDGESLGNERINQDKGYIDVWWLYDDGGLTMLLSYIISKRQEWAKNKIRIFALNTLKENLEIEEKNMKNLLKKFRLEYSSITMVSLAEEPRNFTKDFLKDITTEYKRNKNKNERQKIDSCINSNEEKTHRQLRLRELLLEHSKSANLIVMSMPIPKKDQIPSYLFMTWLEILTKDLPPYLLVRGNQQSVLTFYS